MTIKMNVQSLTTVLDMTTLQVFIKIGAMVQELSGHKTRDKNLLESHQESVELNHRGFKTNSLRSIKLKYIYK